MENLSTATWGEIIQHILGIRTKDEAERFYQQYVGFLLEKQADLLRNQAEDIARDNIGWCYGEGMSQEQKAMWWVATGGAEHPVFGLDSPTAEDAFRMGRELGERLKEQRS